MNAHAVVEKVWGSETVIVNRRRAAEGFCGKLMKLRTGYRCSLHFHAVKDETFLVVRGLMFVELGREGLARMDADNRSHMRQMVLGVGESVDVPPGTLHRFTGMTECEFVEFSTLDAPEDSFRVEPSGRAT